MALKKHSDVVFFDEDDNRFVRFVDGTPLQFGKSIDHHDGSPNKPIFSLETLEVAANYFRTIYIQTNYIEFEYRSVKYIIQSGEIQYVILNPNVGLPTNEFLDKIRDLILT